MKQFRLSGFTLIELLIVVAIIAILAAIAVPNFLEAQTRSKVSRTKADLRTIATAEDAYFVDWNSYTIDQDNDNRWRRELDGSGQPRETGMLYLTSPTAYLSSVSWSDPFMAFYKLDPNPSTIDNSISPVYQIASGSDPYRRVDVTGANAAGGKYSAVHCYCIYSIGPDQVSDMGNDDWPYTGDTVTVAADGTVSGTFRSNMLAIYDPTNGTVSKGEIARFGGMYTTSGPRTHWSIGSIEHSFWNVPQQP